MKKNFEDFSINDAQRLMDNPAVPQLIEALKRSDPAALAKATELAAAGNYNKAAGILHKLLDGEDIAALLSQLGGSSNG